jgi:hypothetical protein
MRMSKKAKTIVCVPNSWSTYLVDADAIDKWNKETYSDGAPDILVLDAMVKAGIAKRLSSFQMIAMDDESIGDDVTDVDDNFFQINGDE